jgi:hypothetical protein
MEGLLKSLMRLRQRDISGPDHAHRTDLSGLGKWRLLHETGEETSNLGQIL